MSASPSSSALVVVPILQLRENGNVVIPYHITGIADFISMIELAIRTAFSPGEWINHWIFLGDSVHPVPVVGVRKDVLFLLRRLGVETKPRRGIFWACEVGIVQVFATLTTWAVEV